MQIISFFPKKYLNLSHHSGALHSTGYIHSIAPNVVLRLVGADDAGNHMAVVYWVNFKEDKRLKF